MWRLPSGPREKITAKCLWLLRYRRRFSKGADRRYSKATLFLHGDHLENFFHRGPTVFEEPDRVIFQGLHAVPNRHLGNLLGPAAAGHEAPQLAIHAQHFIHTHAALKSSTRAFFAALIFIKNN